MQRKKATKLFAFLLSALLPMQILAEGLPYSTLDTAVQENDEFLLRKIQELDFNFILNASTQAGFVQFYATSGTVTGPLLVGSMTASGSISASKFLADDGLASDPSYSFKGVVNTGMFRSGTSINFSIEGVSNLGVTAVAVAPEVPVRGPNGLVTAPTYSFAGDTNLGIYRKGVDVMGFATGVGGNTFELAPSSATLDSDLIVNGNTTLGSSNSDTVQVNAGTTTYVAGHVLNFGSRLYLDAIGNYFRMRFGTNFDSLLLADADGNKFIVFTPQSNSIGWSSVTGANTACNTTCNYGCVAGLDTGSPTFLACTDATADSCLCAGPN